MLFPKITIRHILAMVAILAIYSAVISWAFQGNIVAYALSLSIALLGLPFLAFAVVYWVFRLISMALEEFFGNRRRVVPATTSTNSQQDLQEKR